MLGKIRRLKRRLHCLPCDPQASNWQPILYEETDSRVLLLFRYSFLRLNLYGMRCLVQENVSMLEYDVEHLATL